MRSTKASGDKIVTICNNVANREESIVEYYSSKTIKRFNHEQNNESRQPRV